MNRYRSSTEVLDSSLYRVHDDNSNISLYVANDSILRTCLHKKCVRIFEHNFVADKARIFNAVCGKICRKDVRICL